MHPFLNRRAFLGHTATGLSGIALAHLLGRDQAQAAPVPIRPQINPANPNAPRAPHHEPRAKRVLMIFCSGGVSQMDTFDYKPELIKRHGQDMPGAEGLVTFQGAQGALTKSPWEFRPRGKSGKMISDLVPHLGALADDMCFIHSLTGKTNTHGPGENFMATGFTLDGFPSMGAWTTYALGSENDTLPAYVAIPDPRGAPQSAGNFWGPGFLPAAFQGTDFNAPPSSPPAPTRPRASPLLKSTVIISSASPATRSWPRASPATNSLRRCSSPCPRSPTFPPSPRTF